MYEPGISYHGDQYAFKGLEALGQGIGALGSDIGEAIKKEADEKRKQQEEQITNDAIMQHDLQQGRVTQEEFDKYQQASWKQKNAIAHGHIFNMAQDMKEELNQAKIGRDMALNEASLSRAGTDSLREQLALEKAKREANISENAGQPLYDEKTGEHIGHYDSKGVPHYFRRGKSQEDDPLKKLLEQDANKPKPPGLMDRIGGWLGGSSQAVSAAQPQATPSTKYTAQQISLAKKALADPAATPQHKAAAQAILNDAGQ